MTRKSDERSIDLDDAIAAVRDDEPAPAAMEQAGARVLSVLQAETRAGAAAVDSIRGCADVEALLPAHRLGTLNGPRALLVEDHLHECPACRARFRDPDARRLAVLPWRPATAAPSAARRSWRPYAAAASILLALAASGEVTRRAFFAVPPGSRAAVQSLSGVLQRVGSEQAAVLRPGEELAEAEAVRTASGAQAMLKLRDGSLVEMGERAELSVSARGQDTTINLERGTIIVQAAKRRSGRLLVASKDCTVQVTGTVFAVNRGLKGSRVSVIEGHVRVDQGSAERHLQPGEQFTSSEAMGAVPVRDEIAWSRDLDRHLALLAEVQALREKWVALPTPGLRHESRLLGRLPANTAIFASVPNYGEALGEAHRLFEERLQESAVLREWWEEADPSRHGGPRLGEVIERVRVFADYLGEEIALAVLQDGRGRPVPILLAEVRRPGLQDVLDRELAQIGEEHGRAPFHVRLDDDLVVVSASAAGLQALAAPAGGGLPGTAFGQRIGEAYRDGAGLLFAADLQRIVQGSISRGRGREREAATMQRAGFDGLRHLIVERKDVGGRARSQALMTFAGPRRGLASWLAAPAPMGSLEFFSPNAQVVAAFVSKSPALVLDDVLAVGAAQDARARQHLSEIESRLDLRLREDVAATLGGEFAVALDGPLLPTPSWKAVVEVNDPARLQASLQVLVEKANEEAARGDGKGLRLEAEQVGGQTYYLLRGLPFEVHYAYAGGYLVAGPNRALIRQAMRTRAGGDTLARSTRFRGLLPADGQSHVSALVYENLGASLGALVGAASSAVSSEQRESLEALARKAEPSLVCAYGREDGIQVAGSGGLMDFNPTEIALPVLLERLLPGTGRRAAP
jgi:ferric-dicitrate binding protein FerR (iron transport regulator)